MLIGPERCAELRTLADAATAGPWHVRQLDDTHAMSLVAVSTEPDTGRGEQLPCDVTETLVAATLVQAPGYVVPADDKWDENAAFIAAAREAVPQLLDVVERLTRRLAVRHEAERALERQIAEAREVLADYAAGAVETHGIDPRTASWIRDGLLDIIGEPDGGA